MPQILTARVLFDTNSFKANDIVTVFCTAKDWSFCELNGRKTFLYSSYLVKTDTLTKYKAIVLHDFNGSESKQQLTVKNGKISFSAKKLILKKGTKLLVFETLSDNWFAAILEDKQGLVPKSFVQILVDEPVITEPAILAKPAIQPEIQLEEPTDEVRKLLFCSLSASTAQV